MGPPPAKRDSYARSDEELSRDHRLDHPLWARKRELAVLPVSADFFSSELNTVRAQHWRSKRPLVAPPPPPGVMQHLKFGVLRRLQRVGLVRPGPHRRLVRHVVGLWSQRRARARWREWIRQPDRHFEIPERQQVEVLELLAAALNALRIDSVVYIDVGAGRGDVLDLFQRRSGLRKSVFSIGIDPVDVRAHRNYSGFVSGAISSGPEGHADFFRYSSSDCSSLKRLDPASVSHDPADAGKGKYFTPALVEQLEEMLRVPTFRLDTLMRQYGLSDGVLHFVKIDAQGSDLDVFLSLGELTGNCLFLRVETVMPGTGAPTRLLYEGQTTWTEDRVAIEAAGFRLLNVSHFGVTPEADVTFVNLKLMRELLPGLAKSSADFR